MFVASSSSMHANRFPATNRRRPLRWLALALCATVPATVWANAVDSGPNPAALRQSLPDSFAPVASQRAAARVPFVARASLTAAENAASLSFEVGLKMRHFEELEGRLAHRELISPAEMQARYLPTLHDHEKIVAWL